MKSNNLQKNNNFKIKQDISSVLLINIENVRKNYDFLKTKAPKSEIGVSIKANAYGLGFKTICKTLVNQGCKTFFVATSAEALEAIKIKANLTVYVLNGISNKQSTISLIKKGIRIVINNYQQLTELINISDKIKLKAGCAIHIDTGMNRLGISAEDTEEFVKLAKKNLNVSLIMSHLACSENKASKINYLQLSKFITIKKKLENFSGLNFSLANSNGVLLGKKFHFNICRPGGLIYGLSLNKIQDKGLKNVLSLQAKVIHIQSINKGEYVGYGAKYKAKKKSMIATLGIGYADGLPRSFSGKVYYKNYQFPIIGNISMDLCTIDITNYKKLAIGNWVEIFGSSVSIEKFASKCATISYEISSKIGSRVKKIYVDNFEEVH